MRKRTLLAATVGIVAGVLIAGGVAFATVPGADGKVWVCYGNNEALRVFDKEAGETCRGTELALLGASAKAADADMLDGKDSTDFYAAGSKVADAEKLDGLDSTAFMPSTVYQTSQMVEAHPHSFVSTNLRCNTGDLAIGGGWRNLDRDARVTSNFRNGSQTWQIGIFTADSTTLELFILCVDR